MVLACWLAARQAADVAVCNRGALRRPIRPGPVTKVNVVELMPFNDRLLRLTMPRERPARWVAGLDRGLWVRWRGEATGRPEPVGSRLGGQEGLCEVVLTDYVYRTTPGLAVPGPGPVAVSEDWRQPLYNWLQTARSSGGLPLEAVVGPPGQPAPGPAAGVNRGVQMALPVLGLLAVAWAGWWIARRRGVRSRRSPPGGGG